jgi:hypothetical protein
VSNIRAACADSLTEAKIAFFISISSIVEPFLKKYQTSNPSAPFLYDDLTHIIRTLMSRYVKPSVLQQANTTTKLMKIDVKLSDNRLSYKEIDIGVAAKRFMSKVSLSERGHMEFRMQCIEFLVPTTAKIMERSPLQYSLCRAVSCLQPSMIVNNSVLAARRMSDLVDILYENNRCSSTTADKAKNDFSRLCSDVASNAAMKAQFQSFDRNSNSLDSLFYECVGQNKDWSALWLIVKLVMVLSHGNASVEAGFSINGDVLVENLHEESVTAQRQVYDAVKLAGGVNSVIVNKKMMQYVRSARDRYEDALAQKRQATSEAERKAAEKRKVTEQLKALKAKKVKLQADTTEQCSTLDRQIAELNSRLDS